MPQKLFFDAWQLGEFVAEFFYAAAHIVHRLLCACVEGVGFARCIELEQGQFAAIFELDGFFSVDTRARDDLLHGAQQGNDPQGFLRNRAPIPL